MKLSGLSLFPVVLLTVAGSLYAGYYDAPPEAYSSASGYGSTPSFGPPTSSGSYRPNDGGKSPVESAIGLATLDPPVSAAFDTDATNFDIYGGYAFAQDNTGPLSKDGAVVGIGVETFYSDVFGARLQAHYWDSFRDIGDVSVSGIARFTKEGSRLAPYVFGGFGTLIRGSGNLEATIHAGVGLDYRFRTIKNMGLNFDIRRTWAAQNDGFYLATLGLRFSF